MQTIQPCTFQNVQSPPRIPGTLLHSKFQFSFSSPRKLCFLMLSNFNPSNVVTTTGNVPTQTRSLRAFNITFPHFSQPSPPRTLRIENAKGPARFSSSNHSTRFHFFSRTSAPPSSRHGLLCWPTGPPPAFEATQRAARPPRCSQRRRCLFSHVPTDCLPRTTYLRPLAPRLRHVPFAQKFPASLDVMSTSCGLIFFL